jgi:hypothetical protein
VSTVAEETLSPGSPVATNPSANAVESFAAASLDVCPRDSIRC